MKFVLRALCLPLVAICYIIKWLAVLTMKCSCYILSPALWFLGVCFIIAIVKQQWDQALLLLITGSSGLLFLFLTTLIAAFAQHIALLLQ